VEPHGGEEGRRAGEGRDLLTGTATAAERPHHPPHDAGKWTTITFAGSVESGIAAARQIAGDKDVSIASASIAAQALDLGLVDEVSISLVPVLLGKGIPYFAGLARAPHRFDDPVIIPGSRVTHLRYAVRRTGDRPRSPST